MEYVEGRPIDLYCLDIPVEQRLRLFLEVCGAVDHAHRQLVIHRDLKPGNILVDGSGHVKLLDFGIAKLLDPQGGSSDDVGTLYLTPEYAAPEQFLRGRLSIATDVYALGAILFELLSGRSLRRFEESSPPVWMKRIVDEQAPKPSECARDAKVARRLEGDLDAIVLRALEADPRERYPSARSLADDVERHLASLPIEARSASRLYRAGKMIRRHWLSLSLGTLIFAVLLISTFTAVRQSRQAEKERTKAISSAQRAERVSSFLVDLFDHWDPLRFKHGEVSARDLLDLGVQRAQRRKDLEEQPRFELMLTLADVYFRLGLLDDSRQIIVELSKRSTPLKDIEHARLLHMRGHIESDTGQLETAEKTFSEGLRRLDDSGDRSREAMKLRCDLLNALGTTVGQLGRPNEASELLRTSLRLARTIESKVHEAASLSSLGSYSNGGQRHDPELLRQAIEIWRTPGFEQPKNLSSTLNNLAIHHLVSGQWNEAAATFQELNEANLEHLGREHLFRAANLINLASLRINQGLFEPALELLDEAERIHEINGIGQESPERIALKMSRGRSLAELGRPEGLAMLEATRKSFLESRGAEHPWTLTMDARVAEASLRFGEASRALELADRVVAASVEKHPMHSDALLLRGAALAALGRCSEALQPLEKAVVEIEARLPAEAWRLAWAQLELFDCRRRLAETNRLDRDVVDRLEASRGVADPLTRRARTLALAASEDPISRRAARPSAGDG